MIGASIWLVIWFMSLFLLWGIDAANGYPFAQFMIAHRVPAPLFAVGWVAIAMLPMAVVIATDR